MNIPEILVANGTGAVLVCFLFLLRVRGESKNSVGSELFCRMLVVTLLVMPVGVLVLSAIAASLPGPAGAISNPGPHGFSQLLYAYTSASANNGSAFAGLGANTPFHNLMLGLGMLIGRFGYILPVLALAGSLAMKKTAPIGQNSFPTHGALFVTLLTVTILLVGGLTFLPTLALGPIAEHLSMGF